MDWEMFGFECVAYACFILNVIDTFSYSLSKNMNYTLCIRHSKLFVNNQLM
jgi:hypothetical protein